MKISESDLQRLTLAMEDKNWSIEEVIKFIENGPTHSKKVIDTANEIKLVVDYTKTVEQVIADGNYDGENNDITTKNFPISPEMIGKKTEVFAKLFDFNRDISSGFDFNRATSLEDVISEMDKYGYRPATLMELLILGFLFPELQTQFPIFALGSVWHDVGGGRYVPCLYVCGLRRRLLLHWLGDGWHTCGRFLGVRK